MKTVCIIQARMNSTRLPGKVMLPIMGRPVLHWMIERVKLAKSIDEIVIATTPTSQKIVDWCIKNDIKYFIGSEDDVLQRVTDCAKEFEADIIVDLTSDCPLVDPRHIERLQSVVEIMGFNAYASNINLRSWFDGADIQVYTKELLFDVNELIKDKKYRQHTGWNILQNLPEYCYDNIKAEGIYDWPGLRLTLDTTRDFATISNVIINLYYNGRWPTATAEEIIDYVIDHPNVLKNRKVIAKQPGE